MLGYYDGRYWTLWKLPMFGCDDASLVLNEIQRLPQCLHPDPLLRQQLLFMVVKDNNEVSAWYGIVDWKSLFKHINSEFSLMPEKFMYISQLSLSSLNADTKELICCQLVFVTLNL